jgi:hypothetical protein
MLKQEIPNLKINEEGPISQRFLTLGLEDFHHAVSYIWQFSYGRNTDRVN